MATILERVARTRDKRAESEAAFRKALAEAHEFHSWKEIAAVAGLSPSGVRFLVALHESKESSNGR